MYLVTVLVVVAAEEEQVQGMKRKVESLATLWGVMEAQVDLNHEALFLGPLQVAVEGQEHLLLIV